MSSKQSLARKAAPLPAELADQRIAQLGEQLAALGKARLRILRNPHLSDAAEKAMLRDLQRQREALRAKHPGLEEMFSDDDWHWNYLNDEAPSNFASDVPPACPSRKRAANIFELYDFVTSLLRTYLDTPTDPSEDIGHWQGKGLAIRVQYAEGAYATITLSDE